MRELSTNAGEGMRKAGLCCLLTAIWTIGLSVMASPKPLIILDMPVYHSTGQLWLGRDGKLHGVRLDLLDALNSELEEEGIRLQYLVTSQGELPITRCVRELVEGKYHAYLGLGVSPERQNMGILYSSEPLYTVPNVVWMRKDNILTVEGLASLKGKRVGVLRGGPLLSDPDVPGGIVVDRTAETPFQNLMKLLNGRLDAVVDPLTRTGTVVIREALQNRVRFCLYCLPPSRAHIAFSPMVPVEIRQRVDEAIHRLQISGRIQHLLVGKVLDELQEEAVDAP